MHVSATIGSTTLVTTNTSQANWAVKEAEKFHFLEHKLRPLIPNHPFFASVEYSIYKRAIETHTPFPLLFFAAKACARITKIQIAGLPKEIYNYYFEFLKKHVRNSYIFAQTVLNAGLHDQICFVDEVVEGLFQYSQSSGFPTPCPTDEPTPQIANHLENRDTRIAYRHEKSINQSDIDKFALIARKKGALADSSWDLQRLFCANKVMAPNNKICFSGTVIKNFYLHMQLIKQLCGTWGFRSKDTCDLTGSGTTEELHFGCNDRNELDPLYDESYFWEGTWGAVDRNRWGLTGDGSLAIYNSKNKVVVKRTGTLALKEGLLITGYGKEIVYDEDEEIKTIMTGEWQDYSLGWRDLGGPGAKASYDKNGNLQEFCTGTWEEADHQINLKVLTESGSITAYDTDKKRKFIDIGKWQSINQGQQEHGPIFHGQSELTGEGYRLEFGPNDRVKFFLAGRWGKDSNGKRCLTDQGIRIVFDDNVNILSITKGIWKPQSNGTWDIANPEAISDKTETYFLKGSFENNGTHSWHLTWNCMLEVTKDCILEEENSKDESITLIRRGKWSGKHLTVDQESFTGRVSEVKIGADQKVIVESTGIWGNRGNDQWGLMGPGTYILYDTEGNVMISLTGVWTKRDDIWEIVEEEKA